MWTGDPLIIAWSRCCDCSAVQSEAREGKKYCFTVDFTKPIVNQVRCMHALVVFGFLPFLGTIILRLWGRRLRY